MRRRHSWEILDIDRMPLEELRGAVRAIMDHLDLTLERKKGMYSSEYRVVPEGYGDPSPPLPDIGEAVVVAGGPYQARTGYYRGWRPGSEGAFWFVEHDGGTAGVYPAAWVKVQGEDE